MARKDISPKLLSQQTYKFEVLMGGAGFVEQNNEIA